MAHESSHCHQPDIGKLRRQTGCTYIDTDLHYMFRTIIKFKSIRMINARSAPRPRC
jgi:hypothetical protein